MEKTYYLLSSGARPQYAEDIVRTLASPKGAYLKFRYVNDIVSPEVARDIKSGRMNGAKCVIAFLDSHEIGKMPEVVPCRKARIVKAGYFGEFVAILFQVEEFVHVHHIADMNNDLHSYNSVQLPSWMTNGDKPKLTGHWVISGPPLEHGITISYTLGVFTKIVKQLSKRTPFADKNGAGLNPFYHISIFDKNAASLDFSESDITAALEMSGGRLDMNSNSEYLIRIHHYYPTDGELVKDYKREIILSMGEVATRSDNDVVINVTSEYDVNDIEFRTISSVTKRYGVITVSVTNDDDTGKKNEFSRTKIHMVIKASLVKNVLEVMLIGIGVAMPAIIGASFRPGFGIESTLAMLAGGIVAGLAAVFGLRKGV